RRRSPARCGRGSTASPTRSASPTTAPPTPTTGPAWWRSSRRRREPDLERPGAVRPGHRHLVVRARVLGTDRRHPVEHHAQRDPGLEPGEAGTGADVRATAERDVGARVGPVEAERVRVVEHRLVVVRREDAERDLVAGAELLTVELPLLHAVAE